MSESNWIERAKWVAIQMHPRIASRSGYPEATRADPDHPTESVEGAHLLWMCLELAGLRIDSETKACRWLGWLQAAAVGSGYYTLAEMKALNLASGVEDKDY